MRARDERPHGARVGPRKIRRGEDDVGTVHLLGQFDLTLEQHVEELGGLALVVDDRAGIVGLYGAAVDQPVQLLIGQAFEQEGGAQLVLEVGHGCAAFGGCP